MVFANSSVGISSARCSSIKDKDCSIASHACIAAPPMIDVHSYEQNIVWLIPMMLTSYHVISVTPASPSMLLAVEFLIYVLYALVSLITLLLVSGLAWGVFISRVQKVFIQSPPRKVSDRRPQSFHSRFSLSPVSLFHKTRLYKAPADWRGLCEQFGIGDKAGSPVKSLSGGERQRLFIVLAPPSSFRTKSRGSQAPPGAG